MDRVGFGQAQLVPESTKPTNRSSGSTNQHWNMPDVHGTSSIKSGQCDHPCYKRTFSSSVGRLPLHGLCIAFVMKLYLTRTTISTVYQSRVLVWNPTCLIRIHSIIRTGKRLLIYWPNEYLAVIGTRPVYFCRAGPNLPPIIAIMGREVLRGLLRKKTNEDVGWK